MAAAVARGARGRALGAARPEAAPRGRAARRALRSARPRPKGAPLVFRSFFLRKKKLFYNKTKNAVPMRWLLRLRAAAARPKGAPLVFRSFFVFVFSFSFFKKEKQKRKSGANAMVAAVARGCGARQERAARFPLVFLFVKKTVLFFFVVLFFKKKPCFSFLLSFFFKKKTGLSRDACAARGCRGFRCQSIRRALYLLCLCLFCL